MLAIALLSTGIWFASAAAPEQAALGRIADSFRTWYGWIVVATLSGAIGTALYPIAGTRVWCRFFCPMAAMLGLIQKLGRFRIRVKRDMCISCGLCSTYCEMGIDVRAYAQSNTDFTRAACVGCGLCAEVCPRGVLRLENAPWAQSGKLTLQALIAGAERR
jgi:polyferredoxin